MQSMNVTEVIKRAKKIHGFKSDKDLADHLSTSRSNIASWKRRGSIPSKYLFKITEFTGVSTDWLVNGDEEAETTEEPSNEELNVDILWLALNNLELDLHMQCPEELKPLSEELNYKNLSYIHAKLWDTMAEMIKCKQKWLNSGLVTEENVYDAIATEFEISTYERPPLKWWEDDRLI